MTSRNKKYSQGKAWTIWIALGILAAAVFGVALSFRHPVTESPASEKIGSQVSPLTPSSESSVKPASSPAASASKDKTPPPDLSLSSDVKAAILNCTKGSDGLRGVSKPEDFKTLDEYWQKAPTPRGGAPGEAQIQVQYRNAHVRTPSGEILRLNLSPSTGDEGSDKMTLKLFSTGDDGLPTPMELPPEWQGLEWKDALARFESKGKVIFYQDSQAVRWDDDTSATVLRENDKIVEAQIFFGKSSLGCALSGSKANAQSAQSPREMKCRCL